MLERNELEFQSIYYYLRDAVLAKRFSQELLNVPLIFDPELYDGQQRTDYRIVDKTGHWANFSTSDTHGLCAFDLDSAADNKILTAGGLVSTYGTEFYNESFTLPQRFEEDYTVVKDQAGNVMPRSWYALDYKRGRVKYPCAATPLEAVASGIVPSFIDYRFHFIGLMDGWPEPGKVPPLPLVCITPITEHIEGFQLGGGKVFEREYKLTVCATSGAERRAITDVIHKSLFERHCPVIDFNRSGEPLNFAGTRNNKFFRDIPLNGITYSTYWTLNNANGNALYFVDVKVNHDASPSRNYSEAMRYIATIRFRSRTISEKDPDVVGKYSETEPLGGFDSLTTRNSG